MTTPKSSPTETKEFRETRDRIVRILFEACASRNHETMYTTIYNLVNSLLRTWGEDPKYNAQLVKIIEKTADWANWRRDI